MNDTRGFRIFRALLARPTEAEYLAMLIRVSDSALATVPANLQLEVYLSGHRGMELLREDTTTHRATARDWLVIEMVAVCRPLELLSLVSPDQDCSPHVDRLVLLADRERILLPKRRSGAFWDPRALSDAA